MSRSKLLLRCAVASVAALCTIATPAQTVPAALSPDAHDPGLSVLQQAPDAHLEAFYLACSAAALGGRLGHGEMARCSQGYELLLQRRFGGDFTRLLAWSSRQVAVAPATSPRPSPAR